MSSQFQVGVIVPVRDEACAARVTQKLQQATTIRQHVGKWVGAWVVRRRGGDAFTGGVLIDFAVEADSLEGAWAGALAWTRAELSRGNWVEGVGGPAEAGRPQ
jgi:hypothetical protein